MQETILVGGDSRNNTITGKGAYDRVGIPSSIFEDKLKSQWARNVMGHQRDPTTGKLCESEITQDTRFLIFHDS